MKLLWIDGWPYMVPDLTATSDDQDDDTDTADQPDANGAGDS